MHHSLQFSQLTKQKLMLEEGCVFHFKNSAKSHQIIDF